MNLNYDILTVELDYFHLTNSFLVVILRSSLLEAEPDQPLNHLLDFAQIVRIVNYVFFDISAFIC